MVALALLLACAAPSLEAPPQPLLARAEVSDVVVAGGSSALGAVAGAIVGTGLAAAGLAATADFDETSQPRGDQILLNNATGFFVVAGAPAFAVAGAGVGGAIGDGLVTALGAGFGAVVGSGAAGLLGLVLLPPKNDASTIDGVSATVIRGGVVAAAAGFAAAIGGAGARAAFDPEALE